MFIKSLHLKNILSFKDTKLDLQPLNVLIGPNASGKSNFVDVIGLLKSIPNDMAGYLRNNGPTGCWTWMDPRGTDSESSTVEIETDLEPLQTAGGFDYNCKYRLQIVVQDDRVRSVAEQLDNHHLTESFDFTARSPDNKTHSHPFFEASDGSVRLWPTRADGNLAGWDDEPVRVDIASGRSVLSEIRSHADYPALTQTARSLSRIKTYRNWYVGRDNPVRHPQRTDGDPSFLEEDFSNLALVVNDLLSRRLEPSLNDYLKRFYESYESLHPRIFGNTIELIVNEAGMSGALPASRLSDGTIRFISLLAILCHPEPPPLICIEEPEIAMHPDSLGLVVELLRKASERTQVIVTTHSPELVGLLPPEPEAEYVVVCERDAEEGTRFHRPSYAELREWQDIYQQTGKELVVYGLSEMWLSGALGGVRW